MAYGQTGSGKTYSMLGSDLEHMFMEGDPSNDFGLSNRDSHGLVPRAVREIFR